MWTRVFVCLLGSVLLYGVVSSDIYIAELMVESNVTLEAQDILSSWNSSLKLEVAINGKVHKVTILSRELVAECLIIGQDYNCKCSAGYHWSNEVCYTYDCCDDNACTKNVSFMTPICVQKSKVTINGSTEGPFKMDCINKLQEFRALNSLKVINVTHQRTSTSGNDICDFEANVYVKINTSKLNEILEGLKTSLSPVIFVDTQGMVTIQPLSKRVNYSSTLTLKCTFEEATDRAGWNLSRQFERFELNSGSLVTLNYNCPTEEYKSCVEVKIVNVTGIWSGTYECGFTTGSIRHTARVKMDVSPLPDTITMTTKPLTIDCTESETHQIKAITKIPANTDTYRYWWSFNKNDITELTNATGEELLNVSFGIKCPLEGKEASVFITFMNDIDQTKRERVEIPVIKVGDKTCDKETLNGIVWPKTPVGSTVINKTCPEGRVGYRSRYCDDGPKWADVYPECVSQELSRVSQAAEKFWTGLGATDEVAKDIFEGIKNNSQSSSDSNEDVADIIASINIVDTMAKASQQISLQEDVFPELVDAASTMLNSNWSGVNESTLHQMSSTYLKSVEHLVKNINVNTSNGFNSTNLDLRFCSSNNCNASAFDIGVNLNMTNGTMKVTAVKNLMNKLKNNFNDREPISLLLSATLVNNNDSDIGIKLSFPSESQSMDKHFCVFWHTTKAEWSEEGCVVSFTANSTVCECNHLTSFSVLMGKNVPSDPNLTIITTVGLAVSICSLLIFLFVEFLVWSAVTQSNLSHFRHTAVVNIAVFRLVGDCIFLASSDKLSDNMCLAFAVCKHLFYLAMFTWMLCLSVMLVHQLIFVFSPIRKRVFMFLSSILGYICPILIVGSSYVYYKYTGSDYLEKKECWLTYVRLLEGSIHAFILPVGTIILANLFSMMVVIITLVKTSVPDSSKANDKETAKSILKVVVFLTPLFGVTWALGFFVFIQEKGTLHTVVVSYMFDILNSFQGLFIFLTGCFAEQKVREELFRIIKAKSGHHDSMKKLSSTATNTSYTKDK